MRTLLASILVLVCATAFGQAQKTGFADPAYILSQMPESKQIQAEVKAHGEQLEAQMKAKYAEYEKKLADYQKNAATMLDAVRQDKESELTTLQTSLQKFQQDAEASYQKKQTDLLAPVYVKIGNAIGEVAKENGYTFILNIQTPAGDDILLYQDDQFDISKLVLKKLGITPAAPTAAKPTPK